jgi:hypothetical protein
MSRDRGLAPIVMKGTPMPYGYKFLIQRVPDQDRPPARRRGWAGPVVIGALALVVAALLVFPARTVTAAAPAPAAHIAAAPTATARPAPTPYVVRVPAQGGAVCILPGGKTISPVTLAEVP